VVNYFDRVARGLTYVSQLIEVAPQRGVGFWFLANSTYAATTKDLVIFEWWRSSLLGMPRDIVQQWWKDQRNGCPFRSHALQDSRLIPPRACPTAVNRFALECT